MKSCIILVMLSKKVTPTEYSVEIEPWSGVHQSFRNV
jgi:hypothetical protein